MKEKEKVADVVINFFVLVGLISILLYYYPGLDQWMGGIGISYLTDLTVYNAYGFGVVHLPSVLLAVAVVIMFGLSSLLAKNVKEATQKFIFYIADSAGTEETAGEK